MKTTYQQSGEPNNGDGTGNHPRRWLKRLALFGVAGLLGLYLLGATAGYLWVRTVRKNDRITFLDVALLRWQEVRRSMGAQQFAKAKSEWDAGNHQAAFLAYSFGVNNDPDNIAGRLSAASFLKTAGSTTMAVNMLEAGLARAPDNRELIERTFELLTATGRDRRALELLKQRSTPVLSDPNGSLLRTYEVQATLNLGDAGRAVELLKKYPELEKIQTSRPVVARVLWETKERLRAIELLSSHVRDGSNVLSDYIQLAQWQLGVEMTTDAVGIAEQAGAKFKDDLGARLLLIEAVAAQSHQGREWRETINSYLAEFGKRPEAISQLGGLAARKGWVELARSLYEVASLHQPDLGQLAFFYSDALLRNSRFKEAQEILEQIEMQSGEGSAAFMVQLRHRQVIAAAARGDATNVREYARRLANVLRNDPDGLELSRRHFAKAGIKEALAELSSRVAAPVVASTKL